MRSWLTVCTSTKRTLARSVMLTYVDDLHSLTHVTAAPSVSARPWPWCCDRTLFSSSINCFCTAPIDTTTAVSVTDFRFYVVIVTYITSLQRTQATSETFILVSHSA